MAVASSSHEGDGSDAVRHLRKAKLLRPEDRDALNFGAYKFPAFLATPQSPSELSDDETVQVVNDKSSVALLADRLSAIWTKGYRAWQDWLVNSRQSFRLPTLQLPPQAKAKIVRIALALLVAPLPFLFSPFREPVLKSAPRLIDEPVLVKTSAPGFSPEDRLWFGKGLRDQLNSLPADPKTEQSTTPATKAPDPTPPQEKAEKPEPTPTTIFNSGGPESAQFILDGRRWSLPFGSQEYAIEDLPTTPEASFQAALGVSEPTSSAPEITTQDDVQVSDRIPRSKLRTAKRKKAFAQNQQRVAQIKQNPPTPMAETVVVQQQTAPPPFLFFLGAPPPPQNTIVPPNAPTPGKNVPEENAPPKNQYWLPEAIHDIFRNEY